ncbi:putative nuclease HARBI1 [Caloenas nicobarica]|uniref:putative nuclease HARBI1 n=1 Tax=Caloenas nicobarica TaxID=187106 RepID=UPI0032B7C29D
MAAAAALSRGAVALCGLLFLRLQRGRRLREAARRLRSSRHRRAQARSRRLFASLWLRERLGAARAPAAAPGRERRLWSKTRSSAFWETVRAKAFSRGEWRENFRLGPATFDFLVGRLRAAIERRDTSMRRAVPAEVRLALTLWRLGACTEYRAVEQQFGVSRSTVCKILRDVCEAVVANLAPAFAAPPAAAGGFALPQLAGVLARLRVPIRAPAEDAASYSAGRGWHAVELQAAVDARGCFWDIEVMPPGFSLRRSALYRRAQRGGLCPAPPAQLGGVTVPAYLLGRPGDPLLPWLLRPFSGLEARGRRGRRRFNAGAVAARAAAAGAVGRLRGRWRCLQKRNDTDLGFLPTLLAACMLLHNVCQARGEPCPRHWLSPMAEEGAEEGERDGENEEEKGEGNEEEGAAARRIREALAAALQG